MCLLWVSKSCGRPQESLYYPLVWAKIIAPVCFSFLQLLATKSCCGLPNTSSFQPASIKFFLVKTIQNQHKHIIGWVVAIIGIHHFLDPKPYEHLYLPPHVILIILRFSPQPDSPHSQILRKAGQKKAEPNRAIVWAWPLWSAKGGLGLKETRLFVGASTRK
jgi:hypothetical protein